MSISNLPSDIITHTINTISFGWYNADTIKQLSVKRITTPYVYDNLKNVIPNGLYDLSLGPLDKFDTCVTCGLSAIQCTGHIGHIELSVPCYNPLIFDILIKLLKAKCWNCHRFRCNTLKLKTLATKLKLIYCGFYHIAQSINTYSMDMENGVQASTDQRKQKQKDADRYNYENGITDKHDADDGDMNDVLSSLGSHAAIDHTNDTGEITLKLNKRLDELNKLADQHKYKSTSQLTSMENIELHELQHEFYTLLTKSNRCTHCNAYSPKIKKDGFSKIFKIPLTKQQQIAMDLQNIVLPNVFNVQLQSEKLQSNATAAATATTASTNTSTNTSTVNKNTTLADKIVASYEQQVQRGKGNAIVSSVTKKQAAAQQSQSMNKQSYNKSQLIDDIDSGESSDDSDDNAMNKKRKLVHKQPAIVHNNQLNEPNDTTHSLHIAHTTTDDRKQILIFPSEVERHMKLLYERESSVLSLIIGNITPQSTTLLKHTSITRNTDIFFLRVLAVPPPRYRPPTHVGDMISDHSQNIYLRRILESDIKLQLYAESAQSTDIELNMHSVIDTWLTLQNDINLLLDNSKGNAPSGQQIPNGIRQNFERKQGLFRQNMMGKRVNYAARSVISPDPFISTREIGVPERFAKELTFPEPVNTHNIHKLRQGMLRRVIVTIMHCV